MPSPRDAVLSELRAMLYELSDQLLRGESVPVLQDSIHHAWFLVRLAELSESPLREMLQNLAAELTEPTKRADRAAYARGIHHLADRLL